MLVSEQWTDNFNQTASDKLTNYRTVLGPGANVLINGPTTTGFINSTAGFTYDTAPSSSNYNLFPTVNAGIQQIITPRLSLSLTDSYTRNNNPSQADQFGLNRQRQEFTQNSFSLAANYLMDRISTQTYYNNSYYSSGGTNGSSTTSNIIGLTASTQVALYNTVSLGYAYSWSDTSGTSSGTNSGHTTGNLFTASVARQTGTYSSVGLSGSYQQFSCPTNGCSGSNSTSQSGVSASNGEGHIWNVSLFTTYGFPSGLSLSSSLGYSQLSQPNEPDTGAVSSNTNVSYGFGPLRASLGVFSDFRQTQLEGQNFGIQQTAGVTGSLSYTFTPLVVGTLYGSYFTNDPTGTGNNSSNPSQSSLSAGATVSWALLNWLSLNGTYSYWLLSDPNSNSLTGPGSVPTNTITISLSAVF